MKKTTRNKLAYLLFVLFLMIVFTDGINTILVSKIGFDQSWNASVAANVARGYGYKVSYPGDIAFHVKISTGETVLLPTALIYKIFGINNLTTGIIPLIYGIVSLVLIQFLLYVILGKRLLLLTCVITILLVLSDPYYELLCTGLLGETAALVFTLLAVLFLYYYYKKEAKKCLFWSGFFLAFAFLTKAETIFAVTTLTVMTILELAFQSKRREIYTYVTGGISGFLLLESYKLYTLHGLKTYIRWWQSQIGDMVAQSSGIDTSLDIIYKIKYLKEIFGINFCLAAVMIIVPMILCVAYLISRFQVRGGGISRKNNYSHDWYGWSIFGNILFTAWRAGSCFRTPSLD